STPETPSTHHEIIHMGEQPCRCRECVKSFSDHSNLISHQRLHSREWLYQCGECRR
ncbi:ZSC20 protein, partial [Rhodinocichla rosea]|nr:ZSC20 protein [Rhodinocichla rosea]